MLRDQLNQLLKTQQIHEIKPKDTIRFTDSDYLDIETLFEMNSLVTHYTANKYKYFNRYNFIKQKELKFNQKFKQYIKDLLVHRKHESFKYVLDIMVRIFHADVFNAEEMLFVILPSIEFQEQVAILSRKVTFLGNYVKHDYRNFAMQMLKDIYLFDFFLGYFRYLDDVYEFIEKVVSELCYLNGFVKSIDRIYNLLRELLKNDCYDLFLILYNSVERECELSEEFTNLKKKVDNNQFFDLNKKKQDELQNEVIKKYKIEDPEIEFIDVNQIIMDFESQSEIDMNKVQKCLAIIPDRAIFLQYVAGRLQKDQFKLFIEMIDVSDVRFLCEFITTENVKDFLDIQGDILIKYLSREFVFSNVSMIFQIIIEYPNSNFQTIIDFLSDEIIFNYSYNTEISRANLIRLFKIKNMNYFQFVLSKNLFDINTSIFLLTNQVYLGSTELHVIFNKVKEINNEYLSKVFLVKLSNAQIQEALLQEVLNFYLKKVQFNEFIIKFLVDYYDKYEFINVVARDYIKEKSSKEVAPLVQKVAERETDYVCDVLNHDSNCLLIEILKSLPLKRVINNDFCLFIRNFIKIRDSFQMLSIMKDKITEKETLKYNFKEFVGLSLINSETLLEEFVDIFASNEILYINLFYFPDHKISQILIKEGLEKHKNAYNKIYEIITFDIYKFLDLYFDVYLELRSELLIDENILIKRVKDEIEDDKMIINLNVLIYNILKKEGIDLSFLEIVIKYSDETNILILINTYQNILVPYLALIISRFATSSLVFTALEQIDGIEILKVLDRLYSSTNNQQYIDLMSNFFRRNFSTDQKMVVKYFAQKINKYYQFTGLVSNFLVFASLNKIEQTKVQKVLDFYNIEEIYEMFAYILEFSNSYFNDYIEDCIHDLLKHNFDYINCVTLFFKNEVIIYIPDKFIDDVIYLLFDEYLKNKEKKILECFCALLNYNKNQTRMVEINSRILNNIKKEGSIESFTLLNSLYQNVRKYIECISKSVPHFSLFLDHKNKDIQKSTKELFANILKYTGKNVYDYFD